MARTEIENEPELKKSTSREYFESIVITAIIALYATTFVIQAFKIPTGSMEQNLLIGDHLLVNKFVYGIHNSRLGKLLPYREMRRGDVVVFKFPRDPAVDYVKRVIGLPGETIEIIGRTVYVNGQPLKEDYANYSDPASERQHYGPYYVPEGYYFVLGDNRDNSLDSRAWGFVPRDYVIGRAFIIYWSWEANRADYQKTGLAERAEQIVDLVINFFTKTRWTRTFKIVR